MHLPRPVAFVLGAGGSHGAVQVGQLHALHDAGIRPDLVVGSSVGALNGALVAADPDHAATRLDTLWRGLRGRDLFPLGGRRSLCSPRGLTELVRRHLPADARLDELPVPLHVVATDTAACRPRVLSGTPLLPSLLASCAIPFLLPAVTIDGVRLTDGGTRHDLPVLEAFMLGAASVVVLPTTRWPSPIGYRASAAVAPAPLVGGAPVVVLGGALLPGTGWSFARTASLIEYGRGRARATLDALTISRPVPVRRSAPVPGCPPPQVSRRPRERRAVGVRA